MNDVSFASNGSPAHLPSSGLASSRHKCARIRSPSVIFECKTKDNQSTQQQCFYHLLPSQVVLKDFSNLDRSRCLLVDRTKLLQDPKVLACPLAKSQAVLPRALRRSKRAPAVWNTWPGSSRSSLGIERKKLLMTSWWQPIDQQNWMFLLGCTRNWNRLDVSRMAAHSTNFAIFLAVTSPWCLLWPRRSRLQSDRSWR